MKYTSTQFDHAQFDPDQFDYAEAFSRNLGWVTEAEQAVLQAKRIAIAGVGGVGGVHLLTLTRLGIGNFNIADLDIFELGNFNRQAGAYLQNIGRPKVEVMEQMAKEINPELDIRSFPNGVSFDNIDEFLDGVDLYIDGLDFFVLDLRQAVFKACYERGIPSITAAPLGMGTALLCFMPGKMTFEEYFGMAGQSDDECRLRFLLGLSPSLLQLGYLVDDTRVDLDEQRGPSTPMACELCAGVAATNSLKVLLNRGDVVHAPWGLHFDAYKNTLKKTWRPWGSANPLQWLMRTVARKQFLAKANSVSGVNPSTRQGTESKSIHSMTDIDQNPMSKILNLARWAPSGDNTQPWRFEVMDDYWVRIHCEDTRDWCVYDLQGRASQIAQGALLETLAVAASDQGLRMSWAELPTDQSTLVVLDVKFEPDNSIAPSPWLPYVPVRTVQRRSLKTISLSQAQKSQLEAAVGTGYKVIWLDGKKARWDMAKLLFKSAKIRLITKEAYKVHSQIIEWNAQFSEDKIPDQAVGVDKMSLKLMRWALKSWSRVQFLNRFFAGTWLPRIQLDLLPGYFCGAHFLLVSEAEPSTTKDYLDAGGAMQRLWLEATKLGLQFQPEMTPLIFAQYHNRSISFTTDEHSQWIAKSLATSLTGLFSEEAVHMGVFMGRMGYGDRPHSRSIRLPLSRLYQQ